ncbi:MAG: hypothetical protein QGH45_20965, partial [Myxococcota bacterium]|nr:hypothetical protein [Myxococcota bacterium]
MRTLPSAVVALLFAGLWLWTPVAGAQTVIMEQNFNGGQMPSGWLHWPGGTNPLCSEVDFSEVGLFGSSLNLASNDGAGCDQATGVQSIEIDVTGCTTIGISGWFMDLGDDSDLCVASWAPDVPPDGDCLGYSFDGTTFDLLADLVDEPEDTLLPLVDTFANPGETSLWLYFAEADEYPVPDQGLAFDDLQIICDPAAHETDCNDGTDEDLDGLTDCEDLDCSTDPACVGGGEICDNGVDDDQDGQEDCQDPDCFGDPACVLGEICDNGVDDDGDGFLDCDDSDCLIHPACTGGSEDCFNGADDDGDG